MKVGGLVFAIALGLAASLIAAFNLPERPQGYNVAHPQFAAMQHSGVDAEPDPRILAVGWLFGALQIALFSALLALGARSRRGLRGLALPLSAGFLLYVSIWTAVVFAYDSYAAGSASVQLLGFPAPTAWMLFGIWPFPLIFTFLYVVGFDRWIASPDDVKELERRIARLRARSDPPDREVDR